MSVLHVHLGDDRCTFRTDDAATVAPIGVATLAPTIAGDPPRPDELSNAIGAVLDEVDDVVRILPAAMSADSVEVSGLGAQLIADVEVGAPATLPFDLSRDAAEDVFRTVATERRAERARNPGLDAADVDAVVAACCLLVGIMRQLRLDSVSVVGAPDELDTAPSSGDVAAIDADVARP